MTFTSLMPGRTIRLVALSIIVGGVILLVASSATPTLSCPGPPPQPLRQLYVGSETIVIARVGKSEITKVESPDGDNGDGEISYLKTALLVSSTLKGEPQPVVYVNHTMYKDFKDQLSSMAGDETLLVFLDKVEGMDDFEVDLNFGLKKLSDADLKVYVSRIEELASIMKAGKPTDTQIVEWLVRCAEEPATRWEGTYELAMSQYLLEERANEAATSNAVEESNDQSDEVDVDNVRIKSSDEVEIAFRGSESVAMIKGNFARIITTEQKGRIANALVNSKTLSSSDYYLIELVQKWDDPRLVPYLLAQLDLMSRPEQNEQGPNYFTESLMTIVANKLDDDALTALVSKISENMYDQSETHYDEEEPGEGNQEVTETNPEQEAAREVAAVQRLSAEIQYFITLATSTVPKSKTPVPANLDVPAEQ